MPVIAIFFGIVIRMYHKEHEPRHFHAEHQSQEGKFDFDGGNQTVGNITSRNALKLIREWASSTGRRSTQAGLVFQQANP